MKIHPNNNDIKNIFEDVYNDQPNPLTPNVITYGRRSRYLYELSSSDDDKMFGVTVINIKKEKENDLCKCFFNLEDARRYITNRFTS